MLRRLAVPLAVPSLLFLAPFAAHAGTWKGEFGAGILATSGNSDSQSLNGKFTLGYTQEPWVNVFSGTAINTGDNTGRTAERYTIGDKLDYNLDPKNYLFGDVDWEKDLFGGYRDRITETTGYGRHVLTGPVHLLDLEIGAGWRETTEQDTGNKDSEAIARLVARYAWKLSDTSAFGETVTVEAGKDNTFTESVTELKMAVVGNVSAAVSFTVRNNTDVPPDTKKTDTFTAVTLAYAFGSR